MLKNLSDFAMEYKDMPCLAYTHLQPAQLTTVGKRAALWMYELSQDVLELEHRLDKLLLLGSKGTTGTQASFMELFDGDEEKIKKMETMIADEMGFPGVVPVSGQTYATSLFWQPLQNQEEPITEIIEASEGILEGADLYCIKPGKAPQFPPRAEEKKEMEEGYRHAAEAVKYMVTDRVDEAMNEYNRKVRPKEQ